MLTDFFTSGRTAPAADGQPARTRPRTLRWTPFDRRAAAVPGDAPADPSRTARAATAPALSAASEAERLKRLRASFEDDLAHFLRSASAPAAE